MRYLLCPQCGSHRFYINVPDSGPVYFHVDQEQRPVPTAVSSACLDGLDVTTVCCCGCAWQGGLHKLVRHFTA